MMMLLLRRELAARVYMCSGGAILVITNNNHVSGGFCMCYQPQITKTFRSMLIRYRCDAKVSDRYIIDVDPRVFSIWDGALNAGSAITCHLVTWGPVIATNQYKSWWRHQMETFSALLVLCAGNSLVTGEFPSQRPRSFDVFFHLCLNKRLSKQSRGW